MALCAFISQTSKKKKPTSVSLGWNEQETPHPELLYNMYYNVYYNQ